MVITRCTSIVRLGRRGQNPAYRPSGTYLIKKVLIQLKGCKWSPWVFMDGGWDNSVTRRDKAVDRLLKKIRLDFHITSMVTESVTNSRIR